jgi:hypothetical protein
MQSCLHGDFRVTQRTQTPKRPTWHSFWHLSSSEHSVSAWAQSHAIHRAQSPFFSCGPCLSRSSLATSWQLSSLATSLTGCLSALPSKQLFSRLKISNSDALVHFEPSPWVKPPFLAVHAARQIRSRDASMRVIIFANLNAIAWFIMIGLPNATRSLA